MNEAVLADYPRTVVLKDGAHLVLRPMAAADGDPVAALRARASAEEGGALAEGAGALVVLACDGERVAGAVVLDRRGDAGVVRVVLDPEYRGRRLGTWMLLDAVHLASAVGLTRLEARARPADADYRAALARLDFVPQRPAAGAPASLFVKTLHAGWPDF